MILRESSRSAIAEVRLSDPDGPVGFATVGFVEIPRREGDPPKPTFDAQEGPQVWTMSAPLEEPVEVAAGITVLDAAAGVVEVEVTPTLRNPSGAMQGAMVSAGGRGGRRADGHRTRRRGRGGRPGGPLPGAGPGRRGAQPGRGGGDGRPPPCAWCSKTPTPDGCSPWWWPEPCRRSGRACRSQPFRDVRQGRPGRRWPRRLPGWQVHAEVGDPDPAGVERGVALDRRGVEAVGGDARTATRRCVGVTSVDLAAPGELGQGRRPGARGPSKARPSRRPVRWPGAGHGTSRLRPGSAPAAGRCGATR